LREVPDLVGKDISLRGGNPLQPEITLVNAKELQDLVGIVNHQLAFLITSQVMAVTDVSAGDHDPVSPRFKRVQQKTVIHSPGAHQPDEPYVGRVLHSRNPGQVGPGISTPVTQKRDDLGFKCVGHRCSFEELLAPGV